METIKRTWKVNESDNSSPFLDVPILDAISSAEAELREYCKENGLKILKTEQKNTGYLSGEILATVE